jgi:hypothetical protein
MNHFFNPMKNYLLCIILFSCSLYAAAQVKDSSVPTFKLWLSNSDGTVIRSQDRDSIVIDRSFFEAEKIFVQADPVQKEKGYTVLVMGKEGQAMYFKSNLIPQSVIQTMLKDPEARISVINKTGNGTAVFSFFIGQNIPRQSSH